MDGGRTAPSHCRLDAVAFVGTRRARQVGVAPREEEASHARSVPGPHDPARARPRPCTALLRGGAWLRAELGLAVSDIEATVAALRASAVTFETYDLPQIDPVTSIANFGPNRSAWFKDTEGDLIGIVELTGAG